MLRCLRSGDDEHLAAAEADELLQPYAHARTFACGIRTFLCAGDGSKQLGGHRAGDLHQPHNRTLLPGCRVPNACLPSHVQAEPSNSADQKQEGYRRYMLQRLLPPRVVYCNMDLDPDDALTRDVLAVAPRITERVKQRMALCTTTTQLEADLMDFHHDMLAVRTASVSGAASGARKR